MRLGYIYREMAEDGGSDRGDTMQPTTSVDSFESRWVFQDEDESEIEDDEDGGDANSAAQTGLDSDEDNGEHQLVRTGPRIDSFDVEALEVPGAQRNEYEVKLVRFLNIWHVCHNDLEFYFLALDLVSVYQSYFNIICGLSWYRPVIIAH